MIEDKPFVRSLFFHGRDLSCFGMCCCEPFTADKPQIDVDYLFIMAFELYAWPWRRESRPAAEELEELTVVM